MNDLFPHTQWLGNPASAWIWAAIGAAVGFIVASIIVAALGARLRAASERRPDSRVLVVVAAVFSSIRKWILLLLAVACALHTLQFSAETNAWISWAIGALIAIQIAFWATRILVGLLGRATGTVDDAGNRSVAHGLLAMGIELVVWSILVLVLLGAANVPISPFIASLGVGGIAVALAARNVLQDLFASIVIAMDKPFEVGHFLGFGGMYGTVVKVGIKTTRITSLSGEELVLGNSQLLGYPLRNYSRREERRVVFGFSVSLRTAPEQVERVSERVRGFIEEEENARLDRGYFAAIEDNGFRYEFVYYVLDPAYDVYVDVQQRLNLKILQELRGLDVQLAVPVRSVRNEAAAGEPTGPQNA